MSAEEPESGGGDGVDLYGRLSPECIFGFAAGFEAGDFFVAGVVPAEEFGSGRSVFFGIEVLEQGGFGETAGAKVEGEVDEGVELTLGERDGDEASDGLFGLVDIPEQNDLSLGCGDAAGVALGVDEAMTVTDRGEAGAVEVGVGAEAFGLFNEGES